MRRLLLSGRVVLLLVVCLALLGGIPAHALPGTIIEIASNSSEPEANHWITFTAFLTCVDALPTGKVTFQVDQIPLANVDIVDGVATFSLTFNHGDHEITAIYSGDSACASGEATVRQLVIDPHSIDLTSSVNPSSVGQAVTFTATLYCSNGIDGTVTFADGGNGFATMSVTSTSDANHGTSSVTTSGLSAGAHDITARFSKSGSGACDNMTAELTQTVGTTNAVTWCNLSGDGRLNSACGDRIVVYCNSKAVPPNIDLWVVDPTSRGHELTMIPLTSLTAVPEGQYIKALGSDGVIYAGIDANGYGYAALQGGPYGGLAKGDWLKTFVCTAGQTTF